MYHFDQYSREDQYVPDIKYLPNVKLEPDMESYYPMTIDLMSTTKFGNNNNTNNNNNNNNNNGNKFFDYNLGSALLLSGDTSRLMLPQPSPTTPTTSTTDNLTDATFAQNHTQTDHTQTGVNVNSINEDKLSSSNTFEPFENILRHPSSSLSRSSVFVHTNSPNNNNNNINSGTLLSLQDPLLPNVVSSPKSEKPQKIDKKTRSARKSRVTSNSSSSTAGGSRRSSTVRIKFEIFPHLPFCNIFL